MRVGSLVVGPASDSNSKIGPMINARAVDKIERHVKDAVARGAKVVVGGHRIRSEHCDGPNYYAPTVLTNADATMECSCEETFGPWLQKLHRWVVSRTQAMVAKARRMESASTCISSTCVRAG